MRLVSHRDVLFAFPTTRTLNHFLQARSMKLYMYGMRLVADSWQRLRNDTSTQTKEKLKASVLLGIILLELPRNIDQNKYWYRPCHLSIEPSLL